MKVFTLVFGIFFCLDLYAQTSNARILERAANVVADRLMEGTYSGIDAVTSVSGSAQACPEDWKLSAYGVALAIAPENPEDIVRTPGVRVTFDDREQLKLFANMVDLLGDIARVDIENEDSGVISHGVPVNVCAEFAEIVPLGAEYGDR